MQLARECQWLVTDQHYRWQLDEANKRIAECEEKYGSKRVKEVPKCVREPWILLSGLVGPLKRSVKRLIDCRKDLKNNRTDLLQKLVKVRDAEWRRSKYKNETATETFKFVTQMQKIIPGENELLLNTFGYKDEDGQQNQEHANSEFKNLKKEWNSFTANNGDGTYFLGSRYIRELNEIIRIFGHAVNEKRGADQMKTEIGKQQKKLKSSLSENNVETASTCGSDYSDYSDMPLCPEGSIAAEDNGVVKPTPVPAKVVPIPAKRFEPLGAPNKKPFKPIVAPKKYVYTQAWRRPKVRTTARTMETTVGGFKYVSIQDRPYSDRPRKVHKRRESELQRLAAVMARYKLPKGGKWRRD